MSKTLRALLALTLLLALAATVAGAKGDKSDMAATLEAKERQIGDAFVKKDMNAFMMNIDASGFMADPTGFAPVSQAGDMMKDYDVKNQTMENFKVTMIDKDAYILTYVRKGDVSYKGQTMPPVPVYCSTVWAKRGKEWKAVYHQDSPGMPAMPTSDSH